MNVQLEESSPIYIQIMNRIRISIISGERKPGDKIPSVRELASRFQVNPNTMQRALSELEREGILLSERTAGRFVTRDANLIKSMRAREIEQAVKQFRKQMESMGIGETEYLSFFHMVKQERIG